MLISTTEAGRRLGVATRKTVIKLIQAGQLRGVRVGHVWKVYESSVSDVLRKGATE